MLISWVWKGNEALNVFQFCTMLEFKTLTDSYVYYFIHEYMYVNNRTKGETQVEKKRTHANL